MPEPFAIDARSLGSCAILAATVVTLGALPARAARLGVGRIASWSLFVAAMLGAAAIARGTGPGCAALILVGIAILALKSITAVESCCPLPPGAWLAYCLSGPGMRARVFVRRGPPRPDRLRRGLTGVAWSALGALVLFVASQLGETSMAGLPQGYLVLVGLSLLLHFGALDLLTAFWRQLGYDLRVPFWRPLAAPSLQDFWGRRWNRPFAEMATLVLVRPLRNTLCPGATTLLVFLVSGLLHEMAISLPVGAGHGGPTFYFLLHGVLCILERSPLRLDTWPRAARHAWSLFWILAPLPLLFPAPFVETVILPIVGA